MKVYSDTLSGTCGVSVLYEFGYGAHISKLTPGGGVGLVCAGFIEDEMSERAFKEMEKRGPCVYKSPVRKNRNSGNNFFFAVFDWSEEETARYGFEDAEEDND